MPNFAACRAELTAHPTQKPLTLMRRLVDRTTGTVLDPFMGSGTTLRAALDAGRGAIGIEVDERWRARSPSDAWRKAHCSLGVGE